MPLDFYYALPSAPCRGPMLVARALGIEMNLIKMDLFNGEQMKPEFVKLNPEHTVPTLVDGDFILWESKAIIGYLVGKYGKDDSLYPVEPRKRALVDRMLYFDMGLHQTFRNWAHPVMKEGKKADPAMKTKLIEHLGRLESHLATQNTAYVCGEGMCVADFTLVNALYTYKSMGVDTSSFPKIEAWSARCSKSMDGFQEITVAGGEGMGKAFKHLFEK